MFINYLCSCVDTSSSSCNCCNLYTLIFLIGLFVIILVFGSMILHFVLNKSKDKNNSDSNKIYYKMVKKLSKKCGKKVSVSIDKNGCRIEIDGENIALENQNQGKDKRKLNANGN